MNLIERSNFSVQTHSWSTVHWFSVLSIYLFSIVTLQIEIECRKQVILEIDLSLKKTSLMLKRIKQGIILTYLWFGKSIPNKDLLILKIQGREGLFGELLMFDTNKINCKVQLGCLSCWLKGLNPLFSLCLFQLVLGNKCHTRPFYQGKCDTH